MPIAHRLGLTIAAALALGAATPAGAALIMHKDLSLDVAKTIAEAAIVYLSQTSLKTMSPNLLPLSSTYEPGRDRYWRKGLFVAELSFA